MVVDWDEILSEPKADPDPDPDCGLNLLLGWLCDDVDLSESEILDVVLKYDRYDFLRFLFRLKTRFMEVKK